MNRSLFRMLLTVLGCVGAVLASDAVKEFDDFCKKSFGARKEPLIYDLVGKDLKIFKEGIWIHASRSSAAIGWDTNLPANSCVEYGLTTDYGMKTEINDRLQYVNLHHLRGLKPGTTYHYRFVSVDEKKQTVKSKDMTFTTKSVPGAVLLPGSQEPPFVLGKAGTTYVLTKDLVIDGRAFEIAADNVTLDLNGHTVVYNDRTVGQIKGDHWVHIKQSAFGVYANKCKGVRIVNGTIKQGKGQDAAHAGSSIGSNPVYAKNVQDVELAGLTIEYGSTQMIGVRFHWSEGKAKIHHNVFLDHGTKVDNRHGSACRSLMIEAKQEAAVHHNLIKRTRQNGISGGKQINNNEICVDSWSTNSFAVGPSAEGTRAHNNRVFGTGFNPYGFGWASKDLKVYKNIIHFVGQDVSQRWHERWGDINMLAAMRVTNYGKGGQKRENLEYYDNLIVVRGGGDCEIRAVEFFSDNSIKGLDFHDNVIKAEGLDARTNRVACVNAQGHFKKKDTVPVLYRNNTFISNRYHVRFGDSYGKGLYHHFYSCKFIRSGQHRDASTFLFGGAYHNYGHIIRDCSFGEGTAADNVRWGRIGAGSSWYQIEWTLTIKAPDGTTVQIADLAGEEVFKGKVTNGLAMIPLVEARLSGPVGHNYRDWKEGRGGMLGSTKDVKTPHRVIITRSGKTRIKTVKMTKPITLEF